MTSLYYGSIFRRAFVCMAVATTTLVLIGVVIAAEAPRTIDFTATLVDGEAPFIDEGLCPPDRASGERTCKTPMTLGRAVYYALRMPERDLTWADAERRNDLANGIRDSKEWPLLPADKELIKKVLPKMFPSPALIGAAARLLDPK